MSVPSIAELETQPLSKQEARSALSRKKLLEATVRIINTQGVSRLNVRSICAEAGLSTGAFYHLFDSKDDVINYYLIYAFNEYKSNVDISNENLTATQKVRRLYQYMVGCYTETGYEFMSAFYTPTNSILNFRTRSENERVVLEEACEYLAEGQANGEISADVDLETVKLDLALIVTGIMFYWCVFKGDLDVAKLVDEKLAAYLQQIEK